MKLNYKQLLRWGSVAASLVLFLLILGYTFNRIENRLPAELITPQWELDNPGAKSLIVVVHGYNNTEEKMKNVLEAVCDSAGKSSPPGDVVYIKYPSNTFSNADCFAIAGQISEEIEGRHLTKNYEEIKLVGYSMGALLVRKAYVYGWGETQDLEPEGKAIGAATEKEWVKKVSRFVLLAGMNRGWTTENRPNGMRWWKQAFMETGRFIGRATQTGRLILQCEKGQPFVANLRMQWLNVMRKLEPDKPMTAIPLSESNAKSRRPIVIQLLGSRDDTVSDEDSRDASVCGEFIWVQLSDTDHTTALSFEGKGDEKSIGEARREWFLKALGSSEEINELRRMSPRVSPEDDPEITEAVIVLHGIRDFGFWTADFFSPLQKSFLANHRETGKLLVYRPNYGYFPMGSFLLPIARQKKVRWFMDEVTELKAKYPRLETIHFAGHSNGTYVLAAALKEYKALKVGRVVLAGSVLRQDFDWISPDLVDRVGQVHNYVASGDWVVAWFPHLFERPPFTLFHNEIGSAGHHGFIPPKSAQKDAAKAETWKKKVTQTFYVQGGHGAALGDKGIESMKPFLLDGLPIVSNPSSGKRSVLVAFFAYVPWLIWLIIVAALIWLGRFWHKYVARLLGIALKPKAASVAAVAAYCLLIFFVLQTV